MPNTSSRFASRACRPATATRRPIRSRCGSPVKAGLHTVGVTSPRENLKPERETRRVAAPVPDAARRGQDAVAGRSAARRRAREAIRRARRRVPDVTRLIVGGPYNADRAWRARRAASAIFVCHPERPAQEPACARTILTALAHRAFRRPVTSADIEPLLRVLPARPRASGGFRQRHPGGDRGDARVAGVPVPHRARCAGGRRPAAAVTASATSSSRRGSRSFCGARFPTPSCSSWRNRAG